MAEAVEITLEEMNAFLVEAQGFTRVDPEDLNHVCFEAVYEREYDDSGCRIRIYSSVDIRDNESRGIGADAIRVVLIDKEGYPWHQQFKRVHRVVNWRKNLLSRFERVIDFPWDYRWAEPIPCPSCKIGTLRTRYGKKGPFMGCSNYKPDDRRNSCRNTEAIPE